MAVAKRWRGAGGGGRGAVTKRLGAHVRGTKRLEAGTAEMDACSVFSSPQASVDIGGYSAPVSPWNGIPGQLMHRTPPSSAHEPKRRTGGALPRDLSGEYRREVSAPKPEAYAP